MKIYFACSITGGRNDAAIYAKLVEYLKGKGEVLTEQVGCENLIEEDSQNEDRHIHDRDLKQLKSADLVVAEITQPSLGVGYEIAQASILKKPILALFRANTGRKLSAMIAGCQEVTDLEYKNIDEAKKIIDYFIDKI